MHEPPPRPYADRSATAAASAAHVSRGEVATLERRGIEPMMGAGEGATFKDAFSGPTAHARPHARSPARSLAWCSGA
jgi:hypothetical protein